MIECSPISEIIPQDFYIRVSYRLHGTINIVKDIEKAIEEQAKNNNCIALYGSKFYDRRWVYVYGEWKNLRRLTSSIEEDLSLVCRVTGIFSEKDD